MRHRTDVEPEAVVVNGDGDDLAGVDQADLDAVGGDHDLAALGYPPLHRYGSGGLRRLGAGAADATQRGPVSNRDGQGMVRRTVPSWLITVIWVPSSCSVIRCPASSKPTFSWAPSRLTRPTALTIPRAAPQGGVGVPPMLNTIPK
jgi:hypothetical protein